MIAAAFDEDNLVLDTPHGVDPELVTPLSVYRGIDGNGVPVVVSCWRATKEELAEINRTGRVWVVVMGETMPPIHVDGVKPVVLTTEKP